MILEIKCVILLSDKGIELVKWVNSPRRMIISLNPLSFQPGRTHPTCQETTLEAPINHDNSTELHINARIQNVFNWSIRGMKKKRA